LHLSNYTGVYFVWEKIKWGAFAILWICSEGRWQSQWFSWVVTVTKEIRSILQGEVSTVEEIWIISVST